MMADTVIRVREVPVEYRPKGKGLFTAYIETPTKAIRIWSDEDADKREGDEETKIYRQTQAMNLSHKIEFCLMAIADGRVL